jgi:hypothetical protein
LDLVNIFWVYCKWVNISPQVLGPLGLLVELLYKVLQAEIFRAMDLWNKFVFCVMQHVFFARKKKNKFDSSRYTWPCGVFLILLIHELVFVRWGFLIPIVLVSWDIFLLCHTSIKWSFIFFLLVSASLVLLIFYLVFDYFTGA